MKSLRAVPLKLVRLFLRNGCARVPDSERRGQEPSAYKKGYEVRMIAQSAAELRQMQRMLRAAGFRLGRPYERWSRIVQPLYGREQVHHFLEAVARVCEKEG